MRRTVRALPAVRSTTSHGAGPLTAADIPGLVDWRTVRRASLAIIALAALIPLTATQAADPDLLARDTFARQAATGWQVAETGGRYSYPPTGSPDDFAVSDAAGSVIVPAAGATRSVALETVSARDIDVKVRVATDSRPTGTGQTVAVAMRRVAPGREYRARVRFAADGSVWTSIARIRDDAAVLVGPEVRVAGVRHTPGSWFWVRARAIGAAPTTVSLRVWPHGSPTPAAWSVVATDATDDIRAVGSTGLRAHLDRTATRFPVTYSFDDLRVRRPTRSTQPTPTPTVAPTPTDAPTPRPPTPDPSQQPPVAVALDRFDRTVVDGWGRADVGDRYGLHGPSADFAVDGRVGTLRITAPGLARTAALEEASARDIDVSYMVTTDRLPETGSDYVYGVARHVAVGTEYRIKIRLSPTGSAWIQATRAVGSVETSLGSEVRVAGFTHRPGAFIRVRGQVTGTHPTVIRMRAWEASTNESTAWAYNATDSEAALQAPGSVGLMAYVSRSSTNANVRFAFDEFRATAPNGEPLPPVDSAPLPDPTPSPSPTPTPSTAPSSSPNPSPSPTPGPTPSPSPSPDPSPLPAGAHVVAVNGSDSDPGTAARPWRTLQKAADSVSAGDSVYVRAGTYVGFTMRRSGTPAAPISFLRYPGDARPVIDGALDGRVNIVRFNNVHDIRFSGFVVRNAQGGDFSGSGVLTEVSAHHIVISDNVVHDNQSWGINLHSSKHITVRDNDVYGNAMGIQVSYLGEGVRVLDNEVHHNDRMLRNTPSSVGRNDDSGAVGIGFHKATGPATVSGNRVWGNRAASYDYVWDGSAFDIYGSSNITYTDNVAWDNENILETGTDGGLPCRNNTFVRNIAWAGTTEGRSWGLFLRCGTDMLIANNTFYKIETFLFSLGTSSQTYSSDIEGLRIINNIAYMGDGMVYGITTSLPTSVVIDRNLVHSDTGYIAWIDGVGSTRSLATFRSWTGYEETGFDADPRFQDVATHDYRLRAGSPAIDAGMDLPGVTDTYTGAAPDLGRYERP